jgi:hypothetical protein
MAIDTQKLKAYLSSSYSIGAKPLLPPGLDEDDVDEIREALDNPASEEAQMARKLSVMAGYMELSESAGAFSCGNCEYVTPEGYCLHEQIRAQVSGEYGCCNFFAPTDKGTVTFPPTNKPSILKDTEGPSTPPARSDAY